MAWTTCKYCQEKSNGYRNSRTHQEANHPKEYVRDEASRSLHLAESYLDTNERDLEQHDTLDKALTDFPNLPTFARETLTKARDAKLSQYYWSVRQHKDQGLETTTRTLLVEDMERERRSIEHHRGALEKAEAALQTTTKV